MGLFDRFIKREEAYLTAQNYFKILNAYKPVFHNWDGCIYESELVRSAIDARARHISKLKVDVYGAAKPKLQSRLRLQPNTIQTWSQFLYRTSTILDVCNTCFLVPTLGEYNETTGFITVLPSRCELIEHEGTLWLRYKFSNGHVGAMEYHRCVVLTKHQYKSDFFGDDNSALNETMQLVHLQNQGIEEAVKNSSHYSFIATLTNFSKAEDLKKERERFSEQNLKTEDGNGGLLLFPNTYKDIKQIESQAYTVDTKQRELIETNIKNYFGVSESVMQNRTYGDEWSAFYEGAVEPFAIQFSEAMTKAMFTERERAQGSYLMATSNRLQYLSNADKLAVSAQMADRGIMTRNEIREIWNLPPIEGGDVPTIRGEYYMLTEEGEKDNGN